MDISAVLTDKQLKVKSKVEILCKMLLDERVSPVDLMKAARASKDSDKGTFIEAIEFATKAKPELASLDCLKFVTETLLDEAPRVK